MTDKIVEAVREDLLKRSQVGVRKYGTTLDRDDLNLKEWLIQAYEECLDQANYLKRAILEYEQIEENHNQKIKELHDLYNNYCPDPGINY